MTDNGAQSRPPTYDEATGASSGGSTAPAGAYRERNGIPPAARRSMEDEYRPLPPGWVRRFDAEQAHHFYVDTRAEPPRSIWQHPLDDDTYLDTLPRPERDRRRQEMRAWSWDDAEAESTDEEDGGAGAGRTHHGLGHAKKASGENAGDRRKHEDPPRTLGRRMKDKLTGTTHEQREKKRKEREKREQDLYRQYQTYRRGLEAAARTGRPQLLGEDDDGKDVYLLPPGKSYSGVRDVKRLSPSIVEIIYDLSNGGGPPFERRQGNRGVRFVMSDDGMGFGSSMMGGGMIGRGVGNRGLGGGYPGQQYGRVYGRPYAPYGRSRGYGYGGGLGYPMALPLFGGLALGGLMF
ncbi:hypothetical protein F5Y15DRAFT_413146 [Xylariaceae sp. FL0016]|nr:hypothetical protein F5Y15DRAFT_413146 [Xylariaceae sp. FL0016]